MNNRNTTSSLPLPVSRKLTYRDDMSPAELDALLAECNALDQAYAFSTPAVLLDADHDMEWCDPMEELRRAALNHRGAP